MDCTFFQTQKIQRKRSIVLMVSTRRVRWILRRLKLIIVSSSYCGMMDFQKCTWYFQRTCFLTLQFCLFVESNLLKYAPTAADELGCHGILKIDGVSTHTGEATTAMALQKGYHSRTTPPNTTTVLQECDQIFGLLKDICRANINVLVEELK